MSLPDDVLTKFGTNSCNYDGLIYLINGINSGISLTLTQEQVEAINLFIDKLLEKEKEYQDVILSLNEDKQKLEVKDLDVLSDLENKYSLIIENVDDKKYVTEIDEVVDAINYSELSNESAFDILCYLLKYNSEVYKLNKDKVANDKLKNEQDNDKQFDLTKPFETEVNEFNTDESEVDENKNIFESKIVEIGQDKEDRIRELLSLTEINEEENSDDDNDEKTTNDIDVEKDEDNSILPSVEHEGYFENGNLDVDLPSFDEFEDQPIDLVLPNVDLDLPTDDFFNELGEKTNNPENNDSNEIEIEINENPNEVEIEETGENDTLNNEELLEISENEVALFLEEFEIDVDDEINKALLLKGNVNGYRSIVNKLNELGVFKKIKDDTNLLIQMLLYSDAFIIDEVDEFIKNDLSIDSSDKNITTDIIFKTMPSILLKGENGNYDNFVKNVKFLKEHGIDLINLFDFSREVFTADNALVTNNYEIVRNYDLTVNAYNAKYLLLLPDIASRIDFYVEAIYKDNSENGKNEMFDGLEMIKLYPNKLNTVNSETIKRLRFSSENGLKVFGNKEKALAGEITNLNVNMINMSENFLNSLFDNEFDIIDRKEVDEYVELVSNNEFIEMKEDSLLEKLNGYKIGLRYFIGNINVSSNKVIRNYNILINSGVDNVKALLFAICYNLVITKTEYERLKLFVNSLGGK